MSRPIKIGLSYFPHDVELSSDEKVEMLESAYGLEGYAIYLKLLERVYRNGGKLNISGVEIQKMLAEKLCSKPVENLLKTCEQPVDRLIKIIEFMVSLNLFSKKRWKQCQTLTSSGVKKRFQVIDSKRVKERQKYFRSRNPAETTSETGESKVK